MPSSQAQPAPPDRGTPQRAPLEPGIISPARGVPRSIARPEYVGRPGPRPHDGDEINDPETIERIRTASKLAAQALAEVATHIAPGVTTDALDAVGHEFLCDHGAYPSTLDYRGFPKSLCTSINEVVCHGIPDSTRLADGDIINIDITAFLEGVHGDTNATYGVGDVDSKSQELMDRTREALARGIKAVAPGRQVNVIGRVVERYAARFGYGVVREYTGHGVGRAFHSNLVIPHYDAAPDHATVMEVGMVFTVEPMLTLGSPTCRVWNDGWTVVTADNSRTAQFEHTLVVTDNGAEILTLP